MDRRPNASENADHHKGNIAMLSMYSATDRLVMVGEVLRSRATCPSEANVSGINAYSLSPVCEN